MDVPKEREVALVVRSGRPAEVLEELAELRKLGPYDLEPLSTQGIEDVYLDTPDGRLDRAGFWLRRRRVDGAVLLTIKGAGAQSDEGPERLELERPWSAAPLSHSLSKVGAPAVAESALRAVQQRETCRRRRAVVDRGSTLAELALDRVRYRQPAEATLYEVEIEAKDPSASPAALGDLLRLAKGGDALAPWPFSKLATGKAIGEALAGDAPVLGANGEISASGFEILRRLLERRRPRAPAPS